MAGQLKNNNPGHDLTAEELRKGGLKSGEVRSKRKEQIAILKRMLEETNDKGITWGDDITVGLLKGARDGKAENYKTIMDYLDDSAGTKETPNIEIVIVDNSVSPEERALYNDYENN